MVKVAIRVGRLTRLSKHPKCLISIGFVVNISVKLESLMLRAKHATVLLRKS